MEEQLALAEVEEPSVDLPAKLSSPEIPSWERYPGWRGYTTAETEE